MENLSTYTQLKADIANLLESLDTLKELETKDKGQEWQPQNLAQEKRIFLQSLYWIIKGGADIVGAELSQEWHEKWNECKTLLSQELKANWQD